MTTLELYKKRSPASPPTSSSSHSISLFPHSATSIFRCSHFLSSSPLSLCHPLSSSPLSLCHPLLSPPKTPPILHQHPPSTPRNLISPTCFTTPLYLPSFGHNRCSSTSSHSNHHLLPPRLTAQQNSPCLQINSPATTIPSSRIFPPPLPQPLSFLLPPFFPTTTLLHRRPYHSISAAPPAFISPSPQPQLLLLPPCCQFHLPHRITPQLPTTATSRASPSPSTSISIFSTSTHITIHPISPVSLLFFTQNNSPSAFTIPRQNLTNHPSPIPLPINSPAPPPFPFLLHRPTTTCRTFNHPRCFSPSSLSSM